MSSLSEKGFSREGDTLYFTGEAKKEEEFSAILVDEGESLPDPLKENLKKIAKELAKAARNKKLTDEDRKKVREKLAERFFDVRMFGAVLSTGLNAGQVRGPVQLTFARSLDPVAPLDVRITRVAITREEDRARKETEMGRKPVVPYGLYRAHGFFNPFLGKETGVRREDLEALWNAMSELFELDRSAARGEMVVRGLAVFSHEDPKGNAPAHRLFDLIKVERRQDVRTPRSFSDYRVMAPMGGSLEAYGFPKVHLTWLVRPEGMEELPSDVG
ncbi:type I-C CRISPR-associated protein Cas7/Csd2 [Thermus brockianus]